MKRHSRVPILLRETWKLFDFRIKVRRIERTCSRGNIPQQTGSSAGIRHGVGSLKWPRAVRSPRADYYHHRRSETANRSCDETTETLNMMGPSEVLQCTDRDLTDSTSDCPKSVITSGVRAAIQPIFSSKPTTHVFKTPQHLFHVDQHSL